MKKVHRRTRRRGAFTLLEVLIVIVLIGVLAALVVPNLWGVAESRKVEIAKSMVNSGLNGTLNVFMGVMGRFPKELKELVEAPDDEKDAKKWQGSGPFIKSAEELRDPWGNEFTYRYPGEINAKGYDLISPGPDGNVGTDDDVTNFPTAR